jgi:hypothetical protein
MIAEQLDCPSGKDAFPDFGSAHRVATDYCQRHRHRLYTYPCPECGWWHNTSQHQRLGKIPKAIANRSARVPAAVAA